MRMRVLLPAAGFMAFAAFAMPAPVLAAHAGAPYTNVHHRDDAGNDTGDSRVDQLNQAQLDHSQGGGMSTGMSGGSPGPQFGGGR